MKRDMDLMRAILFEVEKWPFGACQPVQIPDHSQEEIAYHVYLLANAGLIDALDVSSSDGMDWYPKHLTFAGHEFLDAGREERTWSKAKDSVLKTTGTLTLEAMKTALSLLIQQGIKGALS